MSNTNSIRLVVTFHGRVQGVGFRYTTHRIAKRHDVVGFVKNMPDGTVQMVAEGPKAEAEALLADIEEAMTGFISETKVDRRDALGKFSGFEIRY